MIILLHKRSIVLWASRHASPICFFGRNAFSLPLLNLIYTTSVLAYNPSSSLCDTSSNDVFFVTEIPPYCYNISVDEMESMINKNGSRTIKVYAAHFFLIACFIISFIHVGVRLISFSRFFVSSCFL